MHILNDCIAFSKIRQETFGQHKLDLDTLIENKKTEKVLHKIVKYFKKTFKFSLKNVHSINYHPDKDKINVNSHTSINKQFYYTGAMNALK